MDQEIIDSHIDVFGNSKDYSGIFTKYGFKTEREMLSKVEALSKKQLQELVITTLKNFDYDEEELVKIIGFIYRKIFD
jgi:hypothetical protein